MVNVTINGINVDFPFQPYPCQVTYMEKVIQCLKEGKNGVLESPTGTGKTLSLLCAALAWRETYAARLQLERVGKISDDVRNSLGAQLSNAGGLNEGGSWERGFSDIPKIVYASRTHSQLSQAVNELKNTRYSPKVAVLGSRDQMCINSEVLKEETNNGKVHMCRVKVASKSCFYYNNLEASKGKVPGAILDIEDLVSVGAEQRFCPYYMARELRKEADLIFMPYNYVLDFKARSAHGIDLNNTIILLDEAHNVESVCENNASFDLTSFDIASCVEEAQQCVEILLEREEEGCTEEYTSGDLDSTDAGCMKNMFLKFESFICDIKLNQADCTTKSPTFLFNELNRLNINSQSKEQILDTLEKMSGVLTGTGRKGFKSRSYALDKFAASLQVMFSRVSDSSSSQDITTQKFYKVHIHAEKVVEKKNNLDAWTSNSNKSKGGRTLSYWCFNPGLTMKDLTGQGVRSLILTSGTLSPLNSFKQELKIPFDVELENGHVIQPYQVFVGIIPKGPDGKKLNSSYQYRSNPEYQVSLGNTIVNLSRIIPHGMLVFFPSYPVMDMIVEKWKTCGIWDRLSTQKGLFVEPRRKAGLLEAMQDFYEKINDPELKGAIFFAVCRGKVSEGLDFADANGRAVVVTGLPFPPSFDSRVVLKMQYLDENKTNESLASKLWYRQQASRAVNQAIGRVIRHKDDFGAILLCDERFAYSDAKNQLPLWLKPKVKEYKDFGHVQKDLSWFFRDLQQKMGYEAVPKNKKRGLPDDIDPVDFNTNQNNKIRKIIQHTTSFTSNFNNTTSTSYKSTTPLNMNASLSLSILDQRKEKKKSFFESMNHETTSSVIKESRTSTSNDINIQNMENQSSSKMKSKKLKIVRNNNITEKVEKPEKFNSFRDDAKLYLQKAKSYLPKDKYDLFGKALRLYKQSSNINVLISQCEKIFEKGRPEHIDLLMGFSMFIKKESDKREYSGLCRKYTGDDCVICCDIAFKPFQSPCHHIACYMCWMKQSSVVTCPICKQSFKRKRIKKLLMCGAIRPRNFAFAQDKISRAPVSLIQAMRIN